MEKAGTTFEKHINAHWLWNYLYYYYCLKSKPSTDYTGLEFDIFNKIYHDEVSWFPAMGEDDSGEVKVVFDELTDKIKGVFSFYE